MNAHCNPLGYKGFEECLCENGFIMVNNKCSLPTDTIEFNVTFKYDFKKMNKNPTPFQYFASVSTQDSIKFPNIDPAGFMKALESMKKENDKLNEAMRNDVKHNEILNSLKISFFEILKTTFGAKDSYRLNVENCNPENSNKYYNCKLTISLDDNLEKFFGKSQNKQEKFAESLNNTCRGEGDNCFFTLTSEILTISRGSLKKDNFKKYQVYKFSPLF
jgi:hypothetical protein